MTLEQRARTIADGLAAGCTRTEILADVERLRSDLERLGLGGWSIGETVACIPDWAQIPMASG
jgi:hypothetical protein